MTAPTGQLVEEFLAAVPNENRRGDARRLIALMREVTGEEPVMWGPSIIGFGRYHYRYDSGHEGDSALAGFSPRKQHLVVYLVGGFEDRYASALARIGPHKTGKGCLYLKSLDRVDLAVLRELVDRSVRVHKGVDRASS
ncbi:DUF1801 domain-containing protein [Micromonospora parva]|uniref:DUF1801 domain-containing protein n=1 Tax=Micromonospora parva TaxID=1464048 RepID=UPI0037B5152E